MSASAAATRIQSLIDGGWELVDIAKACGVSWFTAYRWSRGQHAPQESQARFLEALPVSRGRGPIFVKIKVA